MTRYSKETYEKLFDALLTQELSLASEVSAETIQAAMKRVLGACIRKGVISLYSRLLIDQQFNVHVTIKDPAGDVLALTLYYGG